MYTKVATRPCMTNTFFEKDIFDCWQWTIHCINYSIWLVDFMVCQILGELSNARVFFF